MRWNRALINFYESYYHELKEYEISPYQVDIRMKEFPGRSGGSFRAPLEDQSILNAEFDLSMRWLGPLGEYVYRTKFLHSFENLPKGKFTVLEIEEKEKTVRRELVGFLLDSNDKKKSRMSEAYKR